MTRLLYVSLFKRQFSSQCTSLPGAWVFLLGRDPAGTAAGRVAAAFVWADIGVSELRSGEHHT